MSVVPPGWYQLRNALEQADFSTAATLLAKDPGLLHARNGIGESVLHFLAVENKHQAVKWLYARGADLNAANTFGTPVLFEVAQLGYRELFLWLIAHGADPKIKNALGQRLEEFLGEFNKPEMGEFITKRLAP